MGVAAISFGIVFLAEMVDTSGLVTLVLGTRFPARWVLLGVCAGMLVHVV
ncbi:MAG: Ca2+/H+ antiporter, family, partial [Pseudonocardiales bacterium]|nr:Ca2+/H+ antiporter, family [Pseudonocardiales bacterium]